MAVSEDTVQTAWRRWAKLGETWKLKCPWLTVKESDGVPKLWCEICAGVLRKEQARGAPRTVNSWARCTINVGVSWQPSVFAKHAQSKSHQSCVKALGDGKLPEHVAPSEAQFSELLRAISKGEAYRTSANNKSPRKPLGMVFCLAEVGIWVGCFCCSCV